MEKTTSCQLVYFGRSCQSLSQRVVWILYSLIYCMLSKSPGSSPSGLPKFLLENSCSGVGEGWAQAGLPVFPRDSWEAQKWWFLGVSLKGGRDGRTGNHPGSLRLWHQNHADPEGLSRCSLTLGKGMNGQSPPTGSFQASRPHGWQSMHGNKERTLEIS